KAALEPASGNYLFFVALPSGNGRHVFTRTYREHIAAQR
ncbi:aminodeoxychorismate lyase, partial [bacterium]|nr:aminodeoxychorismate lyase [bacterium]